MKFTTGQIITVGTGMLACPIGDVYTVLNFLTGDSLFTHVLPRAFKCYEAYVREAHPWLNSLDMSKWNRKTWSKNLADTIALVGDSHELESKPSLWTIQDPIQEIVDMVGKEKVIVIK